MGKLSEFFSKKDQDKLDHGLSNTKKSFFSKLGTAVIGKTKIDEDVLDELETILIQSDVGVATTLKIIAALEARIAKDKYLKTEDLIHRMQEEILALLVDSEENIQSSFDAIFESQPHVVMVVGVNGVGKTTTIGKLANKYKLLGKKVILGASDTFRAGAIDQLQVWADRVGVKLVKQSMGSDPASVAFDTLKSAKSQKVDVVIIDTAGRLHNKVNLMNELTKIKRVMGKVIPESPHEVLLVLDGSTGQNAFEQAKARQAQQSQLTGQLGQMGADVGLRYGQMAGQLGLAGQELAGNLALNYGQQGIAGAQQRADIGTRQAALGELGQNMMTKGTETMYTLGGRQQAQQQAELEAQRSNKMAQLYEPYQRLGFLSDIYKGTPTTQQTVTSSSSANVSPFQQYLGLGIAGLSAGAGAAKAGLFG